MEPESERLAFKDSRLVSVSVLIVRHCRARRGIDGCFNALLVIISALASSTISLASDVDNGGGPKNLCYCGSSLLGIPSIRWFGVVTR